MTKTSFSIENYFAVCFVTIFCCLSSEISFLVYILSRWWSEVTGIYPNIYKYSSFSNSGIEGDADEVPIL